MKLARLSFAAVVAAISLPAFAQAPDPARVERLEGLCKVWGVVKFFHPALTGDGVDWDKALVEAIPKVIDADTPDLYCSAIDAMFDALQDPMTTCDKPERPESGVSEGKPELEWITEGEAKLAWIKARDWRAISELPNGFRGGVLKPLLEQCGEAKGVIIDLRRTSTPSADVDMESFYVGAMLKAEAAGLCKEDVILPAWRSRMHSGYAPQISSTSGGYFSGFESTEHTALKASPTPAAGKPVVILTSDASRGLGETLAALQSAGVASVIHEGYSSEAFAAGATYEMKLPMNVRARVRTAEIVNADGSIGFEPAAIIAPGSGRAIQLAREVASGAQKLERKQRRNKASIRVPDNVYADMAYPNREYRLLACFRLWNVMHYFFPYQQHMDEPWENVLREFIPRFEGATDAAEYGLAIREMASRLRDSHVGASGGEAIKQARERLGGWAPAVAIQPVRGRPVIWKILDESGTDEAKPGDMIVEVEGRSVDELRATIAKQIAASTPQALHRRTDVELLRGGQDTPVSVTVEGMDGTRRSITLKRTVKIEDLARKTFAETAHPPHETFRDLPEGFGYFDLVKLTQAQIAPAFMKVKDTPALIMDMRGYPQGTAWGICVRLTDERINMAVFTRPYLTGPDPDHMTSYSFNQPIDPSPLWKYKGRIVVLIDERAISQSEHSCLGFEQAAKGRITFIGSPTTGANGDVTTCMLPGGVRVSFSGHNVRHADGRQLQRVGIQPDISVEPTVKGLLDGKDEVLEAAVRFLQSSADRSRGEADSR